MAVLVFRHQSVGWRQQRSEVWWPCFRHCAVRCQAHGWVSRTSKDCLCFTMPPWTTGLSSLPCCWYSPWMSMYVATTSCLLVSYGDIMIHLCKTVVLSGGTVVVFSHSRQEKKKERKKNLCPLVPMTTSAVLQVECTKFISLGEENDILHCWKFYMEMCADYSFGTVKKVR